MQQPEPQPTQQETVNPLEDLLQKPLSLTRKETSHDPHVQQCTPKYVKEEPKFDAPLIRFARRVRQTVIHQEVSVRYDSATFAWAVIDENGNAVRHFDHGYMMNVQFSTITITSPGYYNCGQFVPGVGTVVGVATGTLIENKHSKDVTGMRNFGFKNGSFQAPNGDTVDKAEVVHLLPNRHAMFK